MTCYVAGNPSCVVEEDRQASLTGVRSTFTEQREDSMSSKLRCYRSATDQPTSLIAAIAHELRKISGSKEADLWLEARRLLTGAFRSLEDAAQHSRARRALSARGEPFEDRRATEINKR